MSFSIEIAITMVLCTQKNRQEEFYARYKNEYTVVMISKKYIIRKSFCVKRAAQTTCKSAHGFITKWLRTLIYYFRISVPAFILIKVAKDYFENNLSIAILSNTSEEQCPLFVQAERSYEYVLRLFQINGIPRKTKVLLNLNSSSGMWIYLKKRLHRFSPQKQPFGVIIKHS